MSEGLSGVGVADLAGLLIALAIFAWAASDAEPVDEICQRMKDNQQRRRSSMDSKNSGEKLAELAEDVAPVAAVGISEIEKHPHTIAARVVRVARAVVGFLGRLLGGKR